MLSKESIKDWEDTMAKLRCVRYGSAAFLVLLLGSVPSVIFSAQPAYPTKAIEMVVAWAPGGGVDSTTRILTKHLSLELGVPVNITNKPGGNQIPAVVSVLQSRPDGYTLLAEHPSGSTLHALIADLPYKMEDRTFIALPIDGSTAYVIPGKSPRKDLKETMEAAKKDPASFTWTRMGGMSTTDFALIAMLNAAGVDATKTKPVSFSGSGPGITAVAGGHVMFGSSSTGAVLPLARSGNLKVVAVNGYKRCKALPDVPYARELGYDVGFVSFYGFSGPKGLPKHVVDRLAAAAKKMSVSPEFIKDVERLGMDVNNHMSPEEARQRVLNDVEGFKVILSKFPSLLK